MNSALLSGATFRLSPMTTDCMNSVPNPLIRLTATQSSIGDAGKKIVELIISQLREPHGEMVHEIWPVDLVVRASTAPPQQD